MVRPIVVATTLLALTAVAGCRRSDEPVTRPPEPFCQAAIDLEEGLEQLVDIDEQIRLVRRLVETAPAEIEADVRAFLDALEAVRADPDNPDLRDDPDVREAVDNVNRFATNGCELPEREGGGGSPL
ncbi:MAG: hypothetical protein ACT4PI_12490 [Actinomycetota bacterium]